MQEYFYEIDLALKDHGVGEVGSYCVPGIQVSVPPELPNGKKGYWTPEHLLGAAASSCFMETFIALLGKTEIKISSYQSQAFLKMKKEDGRFFITEILLRPSVKLSDDTDLKVVTALLERAEAECRVIKTMNIPVEVHPQFQYNRRAISVTSR